jgi:hypothetical protein
MIDLIILLALLVVAYGGFWCGGKYHTLSNMWTQLKTKAKDKL